MTTGEGAVNYATRNPVLLARDVSFVLMYFHLLSVFVFVHVCVD